MYEAQPLGGARAVRGFDTAELGRIIVGGEILCCGNPGTEGFCEPGAENERRIISATNIIIRSTGRIACGTPRSSNLVARNRRSQALN